MLKREESIFWFYAFVGLVEDQFQLWDTTSLGLINSLT